MILSPCVDERRADEGGLRGEGDASTGVYQLGFMQMLL